MLRTVVMAMGGEIRFYFSLFENRDAVLQWRLSEKLKYGILGTFTLMNPLIHIHFGKGF